MKKKPATDTPSAPERCSRSPIIPMRVIRRFARQVANQFRPEKIILFGSYAYGRPHQDRDVDILVVMPTKNETDQAIRIRLAIESHFPMDLIVRTPKNLAWRLKEGDWFLREVVAQAKTLSESVANAITLHQRWRS